MPDPLNNGTNQFPNRGDPLVISAGWVCETSRNNAKVRSLQIPGGAGIQRPPIQPTNVVFVQNNSGAARAAGEILGIDDSVLAKPTTTSTDPQTCSFFYNPIISGQKPTIVDYFGYFVVCLDPIDKGAVGRCVISGMCAVTINLINAFDAFADVTDNDATQLTSGPIGAANIISNPSGASGKQLCWAIVGNPVNMMTPVKVTQNGGVSGTNKTVSCTFTYDIYPLGGSTKWNSSALTPINKRNPNLHYTAATLGQVYVDYSNSNKLVLFLLDELCDSGTC